MLRILKIGSSTPFELNLPFETESRVQSLVVVGICVRPQNVH